MSKPKFIQAYIEAAVFADMPEDAPEGAELHEDTINELTVIAGEFYDQHAEDIEAYCEGLEQAGHDLWYSHNGHGCGYWENEDEGSKRLQVAAEQVGEHYLTVGDDGFVYLD